MIRTVIVILVALAATTIARAAETVEFTTEDKSLSLKHPSDWKPVTPDKAGMVANIVSPAETEKDLFQERLNIIVVEMGQDADLNELVNEIKPSLVGRLAGYKALSDDETTVAERPARKLVGETQIQGTTARSTQWMFIVGQKLYIVTFTSLVDTDEKYAPVVKAMVDSLTLKS